LPDRSFDHGKHAHPPGRAPEVAARRRLRRLVADRIPSARAQAGATTYVISVLPWKSCGSRHPWIGDALDGREYAGSHLSDHDVYVVDTDL
jgi:hypothetical protein